MRGRVGGRALGSYVYDKRLDNGGGVVPCEVRVFPLAVKRQLKAWPEASERTTRWFSAAEAVKLVADDGLRALIREIGTQDPDARRKV